MNRYPKHRSSVSILIFTLAIRFSWAGSEEAQSMVPKGKLVEDNGREFLIKTAMGTKVVIEFHRNGSFQEASGKNLNQGDDLEPGDGLISLSSAAQKFQSSSPRGYWTLEKDQILGWFYEFDLGIVDAKSGKLLERKQLSKSR
jgi:hypothetical protein